ncbi:ATPase family AAA domain-containing protein 1 [Selaginella moellendorffii]|nr:ATPase family AAA domain-containing protein 1 [Selaginella moellendorffii]|eukprot:XP_002974265.2 ATPase family AAA domain-containing protein 1 [Selaginella moellendorffii]
MAGVATPNHALLFIAGGAYLSSKQSSTDLFPRRIDQNFAEPRGFSRVYVTRNPRRPLALSASIQRAPIRGPSLSVAVKKRRELGQARAFWSDAFEGYLGEENELPQDPWNRLTRFLRRSVSGVGKGRSGTFLEQVFLYAVYAAVSCLVQLIGLRYMDPHRIDTKKATACKKELSKRLGRDLKQTNMYEDIIAGNVVNPQGIDVTFSSIGGLEDVKDSLYELAILPLQRPELFSQGKLLRPQKGVLLYGPPGTGKTLLAKALAKEARAVFINVQIASLMSKWLGDAQKLVTAVFTLAHKLQPSIIFIDEVDSFLGRRGVTSHEVMTQMKTEFMALWDGLTTDQNARVLVLAATNRPWELDEAILRRLPRAFEIGMPDVKQRASILQVLLKEERVEDDLDIDYLASLCDGCSGSDLTELCKQAAYLPIRDLLEQEKHGLSSGKVARKLKQSDFESVLMNNRSSKAAAFEYQSKKHYDKNNRDNIPVFTTSDFPFACN